MVAPMRDFQVEFGVTRSVSESLPAPLNSATSSEVYYEGRRIVRPRVIPISQAYYWTREWQEGEAEALRDLETGNSRVFADPRDAIRYLLGPDE